MTEDQALWDAYNLLCGGPDRERLRKLLVRYDLFRMAAPLPGTSSNAACSRALVS